MVKDIFFRTETKKLFSINLEVKHVARWITPVPNGVGPVTVACLISNLLKLARQRRE